MDINSLTAFTNMYASENQSTEKLNESLKRANYANSTDEELLEACKQFEAYFLEMVFKEMQKSTKIFSSGEEDGPNSNLVDYFRDMTIQQIAADSTERQGLGLAQQLFEQMKRNYSIPDTIE